MSYVEGPIRAALARHHRRRAPLRALLWLIQLKNGEIHGVASAVGILPAKSELDLDGLIIDDADLDTVLSVDVAQRRQEIEFRETHLAQFAELPGKSGKPTTASRLRSTSTRQPSPASTDAGC